MAFPRTGYPIEAAHTLGSDAWVLFLDQATSIVYHAIHPLHPPSVSLQTAQSHCPRCLEFLVGAVTCSLPLSTSSYLGRHVIHPVLTRAVSVVQSTLKETHGCTDSAGPRSDIGAPDAESFISSLSPPGPAGFVDGTRGTANLGEEHTRK